MKRYNEMELIIRLIWEKKTKKGELVDDNNIQKKNSEMNNYSIVPNCII